MRMNRAHTAAATLKFFIIFVHEAWHFHFVPGSANHVSSPARNPVWGMCVCGEGGGKVMFVRGS